MIEGNAVQTNGAVGVHWFRGALERTGRCFDEMANDALCAELLDIAKRIAERMVAGGVVYWCGNGGSSSDAQHLAAELVGRFGLPGRGWPSVALSADSAVLTAAGNDFGFESVFARQVEALVRPADVVVGISTSGASRNVITAIEQARRKGALTVALTAPDGSPLARASELAIRVPAEGTSDIQTCHIAIGQLLCGAMIMLAEARE